MMRRVPVAMLTAMLSCPPAALQAATDLPPAGRSLFDHLTSRSIDGHSVQRIPYPFEALLAALEHHAGTDSLGRPGLAAVLIPLGRSLQRNASAGDYFRHPRVVVAITGEARTDGSPRLLLKDRLFLGFQDEAGVIEVISYNEQAGRFEFQVVTDYRAGAVPRVAYARRAVCSACHHAAAPIFSRPGWDETNANPAVARALSAHAQSFHGVAVKRGVDVPNAIDDSVARANRMAAAQTLWRRGCDAVQAPSDPIACREALLLAVLDRRLRAAQARYRTQPPQSALDPLAASWATLWPQGLAVPDPNIPNRDPFFGQAQQFAAERPVAPWGAEEVVPALDPMSARPPVDRWRPDARGMDALLHTLGTFFAEADVHALERALARGEMGTGRLPGSEHTPQRDAMRDQSGQNPKMLVATANRAEEPARRLTRAVAALADETRAGTSDALASAAFRRGALLRALAPHLGMELELDCCDQAAPALAPAVLEGAARSVPAAIPESLRPFYTHCAACHDMPTASPPGFLHGSIETVTRNIARCAPRIRYRLAMWQLPAESRSKTPMPPPVFVPAWERAAPRADIERMIDYAIRAMPVTATGRAPERGYEALPQCREPGLETHGARAQ
ncbi:MAG: hypothetical protein ACREUX_13535 [Burkholderiales bacterium]